MSIIAIAPAGFHGTDAARERREIRQAITKLKFSNNEKAALQFVVNLWFVHRGKGSIFPGRAAIAKRVGVSVRTAATLLAKFRNLRFIQAVEYAKGGRKSTRYTVCLDAIRDAVSPPIKVAVGQLNLVPTERANQSIPEPKPCKICTRVFKKAKASPSRSRGKGKAEIIRPPEFSIWRGTARKSFLGWVSRQTWLTLTAKQILDAIGESLCPDNGLTSASNRLLARQTGLTRREIDREIQSLSGQGILHIEVESRSRRRIMAGNAMQEILAEAPGMPF